MAQPVGHCLGANGWRALAVALLVADAVGTVVLLNSGNSPRLRHHRSRDLRQRCPLYPRIDLPDYTTAVARLAAATRSPHMVRPWRRSPWDGRFFVTTLRRAPAVIRAACHDGTACLLPFLTRLPP